MDPTTAATSIFGVLGVLAAAFERFRSQRASARAEISAREREEATAAAAVATSEITKQQAVNEQIIAGKEELCKIAREAGEAWKNRYDEAHAEFATYRATSHERAQEAQALILRFTAENAELRNKTDVTPILEHQRTQSEINMKIIQALDEILMHFKESHQKPAAPKKKTI